MRSRPLRVAMSAVSDALVRKPHSTSAPGHFSVRSTAKLAYFTPRSSASVFATSAECSLNAKSVFSASAPFPASAFFFGLPPASAVEASPTGVSANVSTPRALAEAAALR